MVKKQQPWQSRFKRKPGPNIDQSEIRTERLTMRVHPDLLLVLDKRSREMNLSRSAFIEKILVGWIQADPRNPRVDSRGKLIDGAETPLELMNRDSFRFGEKFAKFAQAYAIIMGTSTPEKWVSERDEFWMGELDDETHNSRS